MNIVSRRVHGIVDYASVVVMLVSPWLFGFIESAIASAVFFSSACLILVISLYKNYELSVVKSIPMLFHLEMDMVTGFMLLTSPWVFGFYHIVFWPHVIIGAFALIFSLLTDQNFLRDYVHPEIPLKQ